MSIIRPRVWTQQPQFATGIDWSNPLSNGLVIAGNYAMPNIEFVSGKTVANTRSISSGLSGRCVSGMSGLITYPDSDLIKSATGYNQSRSVLFLLSTATTGNTVIAEKGANANFICQTLNSKFSFRITGDSGYQISTTSNITSGLPVAVAGVCQGLTQYVYFNGLQEATNIATSEDTDNTSPFVVGAREGDLYAFPGNIYLCYVWNRALSAAEVASISANPWQIFRPRVT